MYISGKELTEWNQGLFLQASSKFLGAGLLLELAVVKDMLAHKLFRSQKPSHLAFVAARAIVGMS
jgi:hypothetical protein